MRSCLCVWVWPGQWGYIFVLALCRCWNLDCPPGPVWTGHQLSVSLVPVKSIWDAPHATPAVFDLRLLITSVEVAFVRLLMLGVAQIDMKTDVFLRSEQVNKQQCEVINPPFVLCCSCLHCNATELWCVTQGLLNHFQLPSIILSFLWNIWRQVWLLLFPPQ